MERHAGASFIKSEIVVGDRLRYSACCIDFNSLFKARHPQGGTPTQGEEHIIHPTLLVRNSTSPASH